MKKKNNNTPPSSYRLPKETLEKIEEIKKSLNCDKTEVVKRAVESYYMLEMFLRNAKPNNK